MALEGDTIPLVGGGACAPGAPLLLPSMNNITHPTSSSELYMIKFMAVFSPGNFFK